AAATRVPVIDDLGVLDRTELLESSAKSMTIGVPAEAAHKKLLRHVFLSRRQSGTEHDATVRDWRANGMRVGVLGTPHQTCQAQTGPGPLDSQSFASFGSPSPSTPPERATVRVVDCRGHGAISLLLALLDP